jgi:RNA polymerase sigma-70 factor (ECF subfamily)
MTNMKEIDDVTIRLAAKKNDKAFKSVYEYYAPFVWKVIYRTVAGDQNAATEIVQDTFIRIYKSLHLFSFNSGLSTWIYRIAFNTSQTYLSKQFKNNNHVLLDENIAGNSSLDTSLESKDFVNIILNSLSSEDRFLLTSREIDGISFDELAEITGKSSESLRTRLSRLKEQLRTVFAQQNQTE